MAILFQFREGPADGIGDSLEGTDLHPRDHLPDAVGDRFLEPGWQGAEIMKDRRETDREVVARAARPGKIGAISRDSREELIEQEFSPFVLHFRMVFDVVGDPAKKIAGGDGKTERFGKDRNGQGESAGDLLQEGDAPILVGCDHPSVSTSGRRASHSVHMATTVPLTKVEGFSNWSRDPR